VRVAAPVAIEHGQGLGGGARGQRGAGLVELCDLSA
jgi:hypothetical protein